MVSRTEFDKLIKRFGAHAVKEAMELNDHLARAGKPSRRVAEERLGTSPSGSKAFDLLFDQDLEPDSLWEAYQGVSEPATVPHQSPGAGDTPRSGSRDGKET